MSTAASAAMHTVAGAEFGATRPPLEFLSLSSLEIGIDACLLGANARRPRALYVGQGGRDLLVGQPLLERRRVCLITIRIGARAILGDSKEPFIGVMPRMPRGIMRGSGQPAIGHPSPPIGLAFERRSVAARASRPIYALASFDLRTIGGIDTHHLWLFEDEIGDDSQAVR
jgi:hypothetical protein